MADSPSSSDNEGHSHGELSQLELGQKALMAGDPYKAIEHLKAHLEKENSIDVHLLIAEAMWQDAGPQGTDEALPHYEEATRLAHRTGDLMKEGMVALGHGFALSKLGRSAAARERLLRAKSLAEEAGNKQAMQFADSLLKQVNSEGPVQEDVKEADGESIKKLWRHFAEGFAVDKPVFLFLRGTLEKPCGEASWKGVSSLRFAGCKHVDYVNVDAPGGSVPEGLQGVSNSVHLEFPQLFLAGKELKGWLELPVEKLRERLGAAGVELGEMVTPSCEVEKEEPCHGTAAFSEGLEPWEVALTEMISKEGAGKWEEKLADLQKRDLAVGMDAKALEEAWERLAPTIKEKLENQPDMPCGHTCNTCPTKHDCHLHDAVEGKTKDIEDLA